MSGDTATLELLIQIREELAGLNRTRQGIKDTKKEAEGLGAILRQGFGIGSGMELARRGIDLLKASISETIGSAFRLAGELKDQGEALNIAGEAYQVVKMELAAASVEMGRFALAVSEQTQSLADARTGAGAAAEAYRQLGLQAAELEKMTPEQRVFAVVRATLQATDQTKAFQAAGTILGSRGLPPLLNGLKNLADNYNGVRDAAKEAGQVLSDDAAKRLDDAKKYIERMERLKTVQTGEALGAGFRVWDSAPGFWGKAALIGGGIANPMGMVGMIASERMKGAPPAPPAEPAAGSTLPVYAKDENRLQALIAANEQRQTSINNGLLTEAEKRRALLPILEEQAAWYEILLDLKFGKEVGEDGERFEKRIDPTRADVTEAELTRYKERNDIEAKLTAIRQERMQNVDTPLTQLNRELLDTTGLLQTSLAGGVSSAISSLSQNIWGAMKNTNSFGDAWRGVGNIVGQVLTDILVKLLIVRPLLAAFGIGDAAPVGVATPGVATVKGAGGGTFVTSGPTNFTVGDNPGGRELVTVLPLSGIGQTTINDAAMRMAGGGAALVAGGTRNASMVAPTIVNQTINVSAGVAGTVRAEMLSMLPSFRELAVDAVHEAHIRGRLRL